MEKQEPSLFEEFPAVFSQVAARSGVVDNPREREILTILRDEREKNLSPYAFRTKDSRGRLKEEEPCLVRSPFERDTGRIIYSQAFRRLRHKTQVFFNAKNDHICSRIEHVIYVKYIATTIARALNLNLDLVEAIALGHDLGHAPFGHTGEKVLDACAKKYDPDMIFRHEFQSLRVVDMLEEHGHGRPEGLNLSFEVRDGIVSHCGETYSEYILAPNRNKPTDVLLDPKIALNSKPATLEGCVVRISDKIAYIGRDIEDACLAGIMEIEDIPPVITSTLGSTNSQIINTLVRDLIHNSLDRDEIRLSDEAGEAMKELLEENVARIYRSEKIRRYEETMKNAIEGLFEALMGAMADKEKAERSNNPVFEGMAKYAKDYPIKDAKDVQMVVDYIAGMTDSFATSCYENIYWI
ncbi:MAG: HD domain-containing protein [Clostridiales bacterium]|nr:HD domain-containing protein [Candidatus Scatonaster coprocaballi]